MNINIEKIIDELINGIVQILKNYPKSIWIILKNPIKGSLILAERYHQKINQKSISYSGILSPYVLVFLSLVINFFIYRFLSHPNNLINFISEGVSETEINIVFINFFVIVLGFDFLVSFIRKAYFTTEKIFLKDSIIYLYSLFILIAPLFDAIELLVSKIWIAPLDISKLLFFGLYGFSASFLLFKKKHISLHEKKKRSLNLFILISTIIYFSVLTRLLMEFAPILTDIYSGSINSIKPEIISCSSDLDNVTSTYIIKNNRDSNVFISQDMNLIISKYKSDGTNHIVYNKINLEIVTSSIELTNNLYIIPPKEEAAYYAKSPYKESDFYCDKIEIKEHKYHKNKIVNVNKKN